MPAHCNLVPPVLRLIVLSALLVLSLSATAQTVRYATDQLSIPLRSGTSTGHKILRMIKSGTPLTVLETSDAGYTRVRTGDGAEGWVLTRYLMSSPAAREQLSTLSERVAELSAENARLRDSAGELESTREALQETRAELEAIRQTAGRTLAIEEENKRYQQEVLEARERLRGLELENAALKDESGRDWFLMGAAVALGSLLFGLIIPRIPWRQQRRWDQF